MLKNIAKKIAARSGVTRLVWNANLDNEIDFWNRFLATGGLEWKDSFHLLFDEARPIDECVVELLPEGECQILDVGAGVLTALGKIAPRREIFITAVDPLAHEYDKLLVKYNLTPPVRTKYGRAENLTDEFQPDSFDLVHARNCIDHCFDPLEAFRQMVKVVKPNRYVIASHAVNEGIKENYEGLHQWNFHTKNGEFLIGDRRGQIINVSEEMKNQAAVECVVDGDWLTVKFLKKK